jgi:hypothetical protein
MALPVLRFKPSRASDIAQAEERPMGINSERDITANLQIGPTDAGMVRLFVEAEGVEIPMDFTAEEAYEIAEEIIAAANRISGAKGKR